MIALKQLGLELGGQTLLDGIDLHLVPNEVVCVLGSSGAGKTLLMRCTTGLLAPTRGQVVLDGRPMGHPHSRAWQRARRRFGLVFQQPALFDSLTVFENVALRLLEDGHRPGTALQQRVLESLHQVGLDENVLHRLPSQLSGGMQKRVSMARAILHGPEFLFLDEPTTGLDPANARRIDDLMARLCQNLGAMVVTHDLSTVRRLARRVVFVHRQRLHFVGSAPDFWSSTDPVLADFRQREPAARGVEDHAGGWLPETPAG